MIEPPRLDLHTAPAFEPIRYPYPAPALLFVHSMACEVPRSIAILCYDHVLRLLTLSNDEAKLVPIANDYLPSIVGGQLSTVEPPRKAKELSYLQSRRVVFYEITTRVNSAFRVIYDSEMEMIAIAGAFADPPTVLVLQVEDTTRYIETGAAASRLLAVEFVGTEVHRIGTLELEDDAGPRQDWGAGRGIVAAFKHGRLDILSTKLAPISTHPLGVQLRALFEERRALRFQGFAFHPDRDILVFALLERDRDGARDFTVYLADFHGGAVELRPVAAINDVGAIRLGSFSPDGVWLVLHVLDGGHTHVFLTSVESEALPLTVGTFSALKSCHFAVEPLSLIVMDDDLEVVADYPIPSVPKASQGI